MADVEAILRRQSEMESERSGYDALCNDVAELLLPRQAEFLGQQFGSFRNMRTRTERIYDETGMLALDHGVATFESYVMPRGARWQILELADADLMKSRANREWCELKTGQLFALRTNPLSGFDTQTHESSASLLAFGGQAMTPELLRDRRGRAQGIFYRSEHIGQLYVRENAWGRVDTIHRKFRLTARQARQMFEAGKFDRLPVCAEKALRANTPQPNQEHWYIHAVEPNAAYEPGRIDAKGKPIASAYIAIEGKQAVAEGGYRSMPTVYSRFEKSPTEIYGRGPGINVLPAVRATQQMAADLVSATELMARPPMLAHDDMLDHTIRYTARGITYGGINGRGEPMLRPMMEGADISQALVLQERTRQVIQRAFWEDLYQIRNEVKSHVSATEIMERSQEKGVLLAPLGRQETEWLTPMAARELDLMAEMGLLDDMPPEIAEAGGVYQLRYENPLARMQKADQAAGFFRTLEGVTPLIQAKPELVDVFLAKFPFDKVLSGLAAINAVPASWEADDQQKAEAADAQAQAANAQQLLAAAPIVAKTAKDLAAAQPQQVAA